jgi:RNA polymerase sigma factor (sigma-70 family)
VYSGNLPKDWNPVVTFIPRKGADDMFSSEFEFYQFLGIQSAINKREAESRRLIAAFESNYVELLRIAESLVRRSNLDGLDIEPADLVHDCLVRFWWTTSFSDIFGRKDLRQRLVNSTPQDLINFARFEIGRLFRERIRLGSARKHKEIEIENVEIWDTQDGTMVALNEALTELDARYPHLRRIVDLLYFGGFTTAEVAKILDISRHAVARDWKQARLWLATALGITELQTVGEQQSTIEPPIAFISFTKELYDWLLENPTRLRSLSDDDFERLVADRLAAMGLGVQRVGNVHRKDGGIDLLAWPERSSSFPFLLAAQVKHHRTNRKTRSSDVRDFLGVLTSQGSHFHFGVIVTNTSFSADAEWFAQNNSKLLRLRGLDDLCRWMRDDFINEFEWREIPNSIELAPGVNIEIPKKRLWIPIS